MSSKPEDTLHSEKDVKQIIICGACRFECENVDDMQGHMIAEHISNDIDEILNRYGQYISHKCNPDNYGDFDENMSYNQAKAALTQYISTLVEKMIPEKKPDWRGTKYRENHGFNEAVDIFEQKLNEWKQGMK